MKKILILSLIALLVLPTIFALDLEIEKQSSNEAMILDLNEPAIFDLRITNNGESEELNFYNYFTHRLIQKGSTKISKNETKDIQIEVYPPLNQEKTGHFAFDLYIGGEAEPDIKEILVVNIINLEDAFEVGAGEIDSESKTMTVYIQNKVNFDFNNLDVEFSSAFFNLKKEFGMGPYKTKEFIIELNKQDFAKLSAGFYTVNAKIKAKEIEANIDGIINFIEKNILTTTKKEFGLIINTKIITKTNEGNVVETIEATIKKNTISRLFTTFSPEPKSVERDGFKIYYIWKEDIKPGEILEIKVRTNWLFPFIIIILIVTIVVLTKQFAKTNLVLRKRVSFIRAKGGEFALKVSIIVSAKKYIEKVSVIDRLPNIVKIHEKFGSEKPTRVDENNKKIEWQFEKLEAGETRILSYVIFSKIGLLGKFALPRAVAIFEREGEIKETQSNQTFFMSEQNISKRDVYEE